MARPASRLFHAVVVVGASLSACNSAEPAPATTGPAAATPELQASPQPVVEPTPRPAAASAEPPPSAEEDADAAVAAMAAPAEPADVPSPRATMRPQPSTGPRERCPAGSEAPFPPCFHIL